MTLTKATNSMIAGASVSVIDYGADTTGAADSTQAFIDAIAAGNSVVVPAGTYKVSSTIALKSGLYLYGLGGVTIRPAANNFAVFSHSGSQLSSCTVENIKISDFGGSATGVVGVSINNSGIDVNLTNLHFVQIAKGIELTLTYGVNINAPASYRVPNPIDVISGGTVNILNPSFDNAVSIGGTGAGNGINSAGTINVDGGYIQGFEYGINVTSTRAWIENVYFEYCSEAAVYCNGSTSTFVSKSFCYGISGKSFIKARNSTACRFADNKMTTGGASIGLFDVDDTNVDCVGDYAYIDAGANNLIGVITGLLSNSSYTPAVISDVIKQKQVSAGVSTQAFQITVPQYSVTHVEVDIGAFETTGNVAAATKKFSFGIHKATSSTVSTPVEATDFAYSKSNANYSVTPNISVSVDGSDNTIVEISFASGGAIGWSSAYAFAKVSAKSSGSVLAIKKL